MGLYQLSYRRVKVVDQMGIEPTAQILQRFVAAEEHASPLKLERVGGIEPPRRRFASSGLPTWPYAHEKLVDPRGLEPRTCDLKGSYSAD